jgi:hypothetical protein
VVPLGSRALKRVIVEAPKGEAVAGQLEAQEEELLEGKDTGKTAIKEMSPASFTSLARRASESNLSK